MKKTRIKIGIDEAGRGPWAGPVVACALAWNPNNLPPSSLISAVGDSKKLTQKKREVLYHELITLSTPTSSSQPSRLKEKGQTQSGSTKEHVFFGVGVVDNYYIDEHGIKAANKEAMRRAITEIQRKIPREIEHTSVVIDGRDNYEFDELDQKPLYIVGGDGKVPEIGAASIIAKVFRDKLMAQYATLYPQIGFETHQGYGTKKHQHSLEHTTNISGAHRLSYKPIAQALEKKEKCLVHICCGPDATIPLMDLKDEYEVIAYWYDPNIQPAAEHEKRFDAFVKVCEIEGVKYIRGDYDVKNFFKKIKGLEHTPERGEKCRECYDMRLERSAKLAREMGIEKWTSSLNNSPHKDMEKMFALGEKWDKTPYANLTPNLSGEEREQAAEILGISKDSYLQKIEMLQKKSLPLLEEREFKGEVLGGKAELQEKLDFLKIAFRKNGGFQRSVEYTKQHDIYRQNYCGCVYSDTFPGNEKKGTKKGFSG